MSETAIIATALGKRYRLGKHREPYARLSEVLSQKVRAPFRRAKAEDTDFWAVRDVSFTIPSGAAVGIIGRNGAGKSTLLRLLSRITAPTSGTAVLNGRVASLLDVGTGFHPELSGRENIHLSGAVLGMGREEIRRKFSEIVEFSGIDPRFLDTPVKRYSSGMQVRLGFSVAAYLDAEILIVDEVLAVGDFEFQKRCLAKMDEVTTSGRTILFVSHQLPMVASLCDEGMLMEAGEIKFSGPISDVIHRYQSGEDSNAAKVTYPSEDQRPGDGSVSLLGAWIQDRRGDQRFEFSLEEPVQVVVQYRVLKTLKATPQPNLHITDSSGNYVFVTSPLDWGTERAREPGDYLATVEIPGRFLNDGMYSIGVAVNHFEAGLTTALFERGALAMNIVDRIAENELRAASGWGGRIPGVVRPLLDWKVEEVPPS